MIRRVLLWLVRAYRWAISPMLAQFNDWQLLFIVLGSAVVSAVVSYLFFRWVERQAKERGMIDRLTGY